MAGRAALRVAIDVGLAAAIVAGVLGRRGDDTPPMPSGVCAGDGRPRVDTLAADGRIAIAALFGQIGDRPVADDAGAWSRRRLEAALVARGFAPVDADRYARVDERGVTWDVSLTGPAGLPRAFPALTGLALGRALAADDVVYYDGHVFGGTLPLAAPLDGYRIAVLDTCWSTQRYSPVLVGPGVDVIGNRERAITGSVDSFVALLDGLAAGAPSWGAILAPMNDLAALRAAARAPLSRWDRPERYRLDVACAPRR